MRGFELFKKHNFSIKKQLPIIISLRKKGLTFQAIGKHFKCSRQHINYLYKEEEMKKTCVCGRPNKKGSVHRKIKPCYVKNTSPQQERKIK